ncbi:MAG TPA: choice-of-anchor P family protein [Gemmatimonadales bacterium]|jgi:hypothetical protein|nr:choice-of-anchor P family protein [Gemmatimonadales bacterium]
MRIDTFRSTVRGLALLLPMTWLASSAQSQMHAASTAQAYGISVSTPTVSQKSPFAVLPVGEAMATDQGQSVSVPGFVTAQDLFTIVTGDADDVDGSNAVSTATVGIVNLLNGLITADGVVAVASSTVGDNAVASNAEGSSLGNLVVGGVEVSDPAPNTRMDLPGVGYVLLNEQRPSGDGVTTSGLTVNMIHVVLQEPRLGLLGQVIGYQTVGNIIVGSATSSVTR